MLKIANLCDFLPFKRRTMIIYSITEARKHWKKVIELVEIQKIPVYIKRYNKIVAVIMPIDDDVHNPINWDDDLVR